MKQVAERMKGMPGFSIDKVAAAAGNDPTVLRLENLDTDLLPPAAALKATREAVGDDDSNSYLPFTGRRDLCEALTLHLESQTGHKYDPLTEVVITSGGTEGIMDSLLAICNPGDEVVVTDPTYAGMIYRIKMTGAVPKFVPFHLVAQKKADGSVSESWRLDLNALKNSVGPKTRAIFIMSPSMPSGALLNMEEWQAVAELCIRHDIWLLYNAAMERIIYDGLPYIHPASLPGMAERTITIGSVSKEYRMIGWRLGWVVGPVEILPSIAQAHIYNVVTPTGLTQTAALAALRSPLSDLEGAVREWERRRNAIVAQLQGFPLIPAAGGWSMLLDVGKMGYSAVEASELLLEKGKIAATPMDSWGDVNSTQFIRFVFTNEPVERLSDMRERLLNALPPKEDSPYAHLCPN